MADPASEFRMAILAALGYAPDVIEPGKLHRFATSDKRSDLAGWCKLFPDLRGGVYGCMRAGIREHWRADADRPMTRQQRAELARQVAQDAAEREREDRQRWAVNARRIAHLWAQCVPLAPGDPVTLYLKRRGFDGVPLPSCLRLHRAMPYWHKGEKPRTFAAMVAPMTAPDGRVVALHRTFLTTDGRKADVRSERKVTPGAEPLAGAGIALHEPARGVLGIAEGIETAMGAWCASTLPTHAAYCAGNLAAWQWPAGVRRVVIFPDNDPSGRKAAETLRARVLRAGLRCDVLTPTDEGADWCDVWAQRGAVTIEGAAA